MKRRDYIILLAVSIISGLIGGFIANQIFGGKTAIAQDGQEPPELFEAQEFRLVDGHGKVQAALALSSTSKEPYLIINGKDGKQRFILDLDEGNPRMILKDNEAQTRLILGTSEVTSRFKGTIEKRPPSSLVMFNKEGKLIWSAP